MKTRRQTKILELIKKYEIETQEDLASAPASGGRQESRNKAKQSSSALLFFISGYSPRLYIMQRRTARRLSSQKDFHKKQRTI